jgi:hypothetical protein
MDQTYKQMYFALREDLINNLKCCWADAREKPANPEELAASIANVLFELSPESGDDATAAILADAKSIADDLSHPHSLRSNAA